MKPEVVLDGVPFAEGPVWCPDGSLVISHLAPGGLRRIWPRTGQSRLIARTKGSANAAQLASDGGFVITQNGGTDFMAYAAMLGLTKDSCPPHEPVPPGIQRVSPEGEVSYLRAGEVRAPNDLVVDRSGTIFFTDPGRPGAATDRLGRLMALEPNGELRVIASDFCYDNGIALSPDGRILVVEANGLMWVGRDGEKEWLIEQLGEHPGDGFCFDVEGRIYVASPLAHAIYVLEANGRVGEVIQLTEGSLVTNVCFGGPDLRTLFAVEIMPGRLHAIENMPCAGLALTPWPVPSGQITVSR